VKHVLEADGQIYLQSLDDVQDELFYTEPVQEADTARRVQHEDHISSAVAKNYVGQTQHVVSAAMHWRDVKLVYVLSPNIHVYILYKFTSVGQTAYQKMWRLHILCFGTANVINNTAINNYARIVLHD